MNQFKCIKIELPIRGEVKKDGELVALPPRCFEEWIKDRYVQAIFDYYERPNKFTGLLKTRLEKAVLAWYRHKTQESKKRLEDAMGRLDRKLFK